MWNRGLNRSREGIQQQGGAHVRQHDHCIPTRICFSNDIKYPWSLQMVERACEPRFRSMYSISKYVDILIYIYTYLERCIHLSGNPIYFGILYFEAAYHSLIQAIHFAASISEPIQKHSYQHIIQYLILYRHRYKRYTLLYRFVSGVIQVIILICNILSTILYRFRREHRAREKTIQAVSLFL